MPTALPYRGSAVPCGCEAVIPEQAWSSVRWFTYESGPGRVGIASAPTLSSNSLFGDFELNSTARDAWFEYSLDGGSMLVIARLKMSRQSLHSIRQVGPGNKDEVVDCSHIAHVLTIDLTFATR